MRRVLSGVAIAVLVASMVSASGPVPGVAGDRLTLTVGCTPRPPDLICTYTVSVTDPYLIFFRYDTFGNDGIWDFPNQTGGGDIGKWMTVLTIWIQFYGGDMPDRACVQGWDGVTLRYENGRPVPDGPIDCTDPILPSGPSADAGGPYVGWEGSPIAFNASASTDPDGDALAFRWDFQDDGAWDTDWSSSPYANFTWGDDWVGQARVEVSDGNLTANATADVTVLNVAPTITDARATVTATLTLRVAGTKWQMAAMDVTANGAGAGGVRLVRTPGSPDDQAASMPDVEVDLLHAFEITVTWTPDGSGGGAAHGASPAWVILTMPDGSEVRIHHTFNAQHAETWSVGDVRHYLVLQKIAFRATASDPGSDDLTFAWDFGDGATASATQYNNGASPDPYPSPDVNPITATDAVTHAFVGTGPRTVTLAVTDDDGGTTTEAFVLAP